LLANIKVCNVDVYLTIRNSRRSAQVAAQSNVTWFIAQVPAGFASRSLGRNFASSAAVHHERIEAWVLGHVSVTFQPAKEASKLPVVAGA
jgi:hypothetical protein